MSIWYGARYNAKFAIGQVVRFVGWDPARHSDITTFYEGLHYPEEGDAGSIIAIEEVTHVKPSWSGYFYRVQFPDGTTGLFETEIE